MFHWGYFCKTFFREATLIPFEVPIVSIGTGCDYLVAIDQNNNAYFYGYFDRKYNEGWEEIRHIGIHFLYIYFLFYLIIFFFKKKKKLAMLIRYTVVTLTVSLE